MKQSLLLQLLILIGFSAVLGVINNLRPKAGIEWIRDWPSYSSLSAKKVNEAEPGTIEEEQTPEVPSSSPVSEPMMDQGSVFDLVTNNFGITDIGIDEARAIHTYAQDITYWIDARSQDLFEKGHISGSNLLYLYEKNDFLPQIQAAIQEKQPVALVIYCKGKDCTDSHHLAQDMQGMGHANIFVYKDGFDDWYKAGYPIEGELASAGPDLETQTGAPEPIFDEAQAAETSALVAENFGITDIDIARAQQIHRYAKDFTLWIDARSKDLYEKGHIEGAELLYLYEKNDYLPQVQALIDQRQPAALVIYCKGKDCTDSHHLAQDMQAMGYANIFVYKDGFDDWYSAGLPIEGELANVVVESTGEGAAQITEARPPLEEERPPGMYLEHIIRDMVPFILGVVLLAVWSRAGRSPAMIWAASIFVAAFFLYAAFPKIGNPMLFASNIWNYDIAPAWAINISALLLPMVELTAAVAVVSGRYRKAGGLILSALLVIFIVAVSFNVLRGHEFDCGCTAAEPMLPDLYWAGWNDKYTLILRDIGLLAMSWLAVVAPFSKKDKPS